MLVGAARAEESIPQLAQYLQAEIQSADASLEPLDAQPVPNATFDEAWYYRRFWLRMRTPAGLDVPWLVKVQIVPEVQLLWERELPDGWGAYKP
jgi:hypothetical protein